MKFQGNFEFLMIHFAYIPISTQPPFNQCCKFQMDSKIGCQFELPYFRQRSGFNFQLFQLNVEKVLNFFFVVLFDSARFFNFEL